MSDYPIVYGFCDAGCKRRVPRYDEVDAVLNKNYVSIGLSFEEREADDGSTYYSVVGRGICPDKDIVIPSSNQGYPVRTIGERAFFEDETITSVTIPRSVKTIESGAFWECASLSAVYLEEGVENIGISAFRDCPSLTSIILPDSVQNIERYAFYGCTALKKVYLGMNLKEIGDHAFNSEGLEIFYHGTHEQWNAVNLDGEWASSFTFYVTYAHNMKGATDNFDGAGGYVPTPASGSQDMALLGNGTWGDIGDIGGTLPVSKGGTGATTKANARKNLGVYTTRVTITLEAYSNISDMTAYVYGTADVSASGISSSTGYVSATITRSSASSSSAVLRNTSVSAERWSNSITVVAGINVPIGEREDWIDKTLTVDIIYIV